MPGAGPGVGADPARRAVAEFSRPVLDFLCWLTAEKVHETKTGWDATAERAHAGRRTVLLAWRSTRCGRDPDVARRAAEGERFPAEPAVLARFPGDMADRREKPHAAGLRPAVQRPARGVPGVPATAPREPVDPIGAREGADRRLEADAAAGRGPSSRPFRAFLKAAAAANRTDLARFVLRTNAALFTADMMPVFWTGGLQGSGPPRLADRLDTQRAALAVPRADGRRSKAGSNARCSVGYFDEDYQASQLWKADWEAASGDAWPPGPGRPSRCSNRCAGRSADAGPPGTSPQGERPEGRPGSP